MSRGTRGPVGRAGRGPSGPAGRGPRNRSSGPMGCPLAMAIPMLLGIALTIAAVFVGGGA